MRSGSWLTVFAVTGAIAIVSRFFVPVPPVHVVILHTNDMHGQALPVSKGKDLRGGFAALAAAIGRERRAAEREGADALLVDAGDMWVGPPEGSRTQGEFVSGVMNRLGYDLAEVGNHEFDKGPGKVAELARWAHFPLLGANIKEARTGRVPPWLHSSVRLNRSGVRLRFIGLLTSHVRDVTVESATAGLEVGDEARAVEEALRERAPGELVLLVTHCGYPGHDVDRELAERFHGRIAAIVGGHTHRALDPPLFVPELASDPVLVVQAGWRTENLGRLDLLIDRGTHRVLRAWDRLIPVRPGDGEDPGIRAVVDEEARQCNALLGVKVGSIPHPLERGRGAPSSLGSVTCDALREETGADLAFANPHGLRADIPQGDVRLRNLYEVDPFGNYLVRMTFTGAELRELLEEMCRVAPLESSGLELRFDSRRPKGARIASVLVGGAPLDDRRTYSVATNNFLAEGGDTYSRFKRGEHRTNGPEVRELVRAYFEKHGELLAPISYEVRIVDAAAAR
jgi:2',3'-cyclic-nucleotide 2'-phosphodiesterase (5'-nucleotidase family)